LDPLSAADDADIAKPRMGRGMRHPARLPRLSLAAGKETVLAAIGRIGDRIAGAPELRRDSVVDHVAQHVHPFPILNEPEGIPAKLKVVPLLVDAERAVSLDVDPAADIRDDVVQALNA